MRGVLTDEGLHELAVAAMFTSELVTVLDDGGVFPAVSAFIWPDGSVGVMDRLTVDANGLPTSVRMTHVASGRFVDIGLAENSLFRLFMSTTVGPSITEFETVEEMLASNTETWAEAWCRNYIGLDRKKTVWHKTRDETTIPNGGDILQTVDGANVYRTYYRATGGEEIVIPPATGTPYTVGVPVSYPTLNDMRLGHESAPVAILGQDINGDGGLYLQGGTGSDNGGSHIINAAGIHYQRLTIV